MDLVFLGVRDQVQVRDRVAKMQNLSKLIKAAQDFTLNKSTHCVAEGNKGKTACPRLENGCGNCVRQLQNANGTAKMRKRSNMFIHRLTREKVRVSVDCQTRWLFGNLWDNIDRRRQMMGAPRREIYHIYSSIPVGFPTPTPH